ncbi:helix-turn-helix domain-containing protein [Dactylosporangium matsuzakiense]|uniref:helix-turn-helix domain-containing protein n=1 Tax=Dactylosporangium matsuzakiense TaxID=53360 RepID=UPI0021C36E9D|nr:helix-turn-helix domain-containing protein [Dactylosporangium matsuzakiense]
MPVIAQVTAEDHRRKRDYGRHRRRHHRRRDDLGASARHVPAVVRACRLIETAQEVPLLGTLAESAGLSRFHFHRIFKAVMGITPNAYAGGRRARRVLDELAHAATITDAIYDAGFNSNGHFYALSAQILGMTPTSFRAGGAGTAIRFAVAACAYGHVLVATTDRGPCAIRVGADPAALEDDLAGLFPAAERDRGDGRYRATAQRLVDAAHDPAPCPLLPADLRRTVFEQRVRQEVCTRLNRGAPA